MTRKIKPLIYVFWEGESEQAYAKYLKSYFQDVAVIRLPSTPGLFAEAYNMFRNNPRYRNNAEITDEIWFFFDVEVEKACHWDMNYKIITRLRKLRKPGRIKIRLLMTTACFEYWMLLHYERTAPAIATPADKERIKERLKKYVPYYAKGNCEAIREIARHHRKAIENGKWTLLSLVEDGLPTLEDCDERNCWLFLGTHTFTTVHEALEFLYKLKKE
ncbi:MAG: RloB domain-containing protein [Firmicutes bacterium]|nr:RloB domain-containing protein [Bacillota bacterium]